MFSLKKLSFNLKNKKKLKFVLYCLSFFIFFFSIYLSTPKILNFSTASIKKQLKKNNIINISNISKVNYKIFPTPRLNIPNSNFTISEEAIKIYNSEINIILNIGDLLNFKEINYKKLIINKGYSKIELNNVNQLLANINKSTKKIVFKKNKLIFLMKDNFFFEINDASSIINHTSDKKELIITGNFLNNKIFIKLNNEIKNKNNLTIKIPDLDISIKAFFGANDSNTTNGLFEVEIFNNFLKFNFIKEKTIKIKNGFIRSKIVNSFFDGDIDFNPIFFLKLNFEPSSFNTKKIFSLIQRNYFLNNFENMSLIKKINGSFNFNFKSKFKGKITSQNGEILLKNFEVGKNKSLQFNGKITDFGRKGKIQFNLTKTALYKSGLSKRTEIKGYVIPFNKKVVFDLIVLDGDKLSNDKTKEYEKKFKKEIIKKSLNNIFDKKKLNNFFKKII